MNLSNVLREKTPTFHEKQAFVILFFVPFFPLELHTSSGLHLSQAFPDYP